MFDINVVPGADAGISGAGLIDVVDADNWHLHNCDNVIIVVILAKVIMVVIVNVNIVIAVLTNEDMNIDADDNSSSSLSWLSLT